jgi:putative SOS response-associated peptidase YedK
MCGRYVIAGTTELSERFQLRSLPEGWLPTWNAAPSQMLPTVVEEGDGVRVGRLMQWGLLPRWRREGQPGVAPINARAETLLEKPMFKGLVARRRCLVPISGFYEWQATGGRKQPHYVTAADGEVWALAGLYDEREGADGEPLASFTVVTTTANPLLRPLHDRMPVILPREAEEEWVSREVTDPLQVERLLLSYPEERIALWPVSPAVNNVRNNGPELIEPVAAQKDLLQG